MTNLTDTIYAALLAEDLTTVLRSMSEALRHHVHEHMRPYTNGVETGTMKRLDELATDLDRAAFHLDLD